MPTIVAYINIWFCFPLYIFSFIHKHIDNRHINEIKKTKTKKHITVTKCKTAIALEIKLKEIQLQNYWVIHSLKNTIIINNKYFFKKKSLIIS